MPGQGKGVWKGKKKSENPNDQGQGCKTAPNGVGQVTVSPPPGLRGQ